jgi:HPr kinase/phosphorylase
MISAATKKKVAVFSTKLSADVFRERASAYLGSVFAERTSVHGTLVLVHGVGVLYVGKSGTGKSECALDLITRGHTLVSDDVVHLTRARGRLIGECNEILGHHMEIRGVGIVNIKELCGLRSVRSRSRVDVQVELIEWNSEEQSGRNGWADATVSLLGVSIPRIKLPVSPGKNISAISEILALRIKSSRNGKSSIKQFEKKLILQMHNSPRPSGTSCVEHTGPAASRKDAE